MTRNYVKRFVTHKNGKGAHYTRKHKPDKLIYFETLETRSAAMKREFEIKSWRREKKLNLITYGNPSAGSG